MEGSFPWPPIIFGLLILLALPTFAVWLIWQEITGKAFKSCKRCQERFQKREMFFVGLSERYCMFCLEQNFAEGYRIVRVCFPWYYAFAFGNFGTFGLFHLSGIRDNRITAIFALFIGLIIMILNWSYGVSGSMRRTTKALDLEKAIALVEKTLADKLTDEESQQLKKACSGMREIRALAKVVQNKEWG